MVNVISDLVKGNENLNRQFVSYTKEVNTSRVVSENLKVSNEQIVITNSTLESTDVIILNHPTYGFLGLKLADTSTSPFSSSATLYVLNKDSLFQEKFLHTNFVNTSITTANINTSNNTLSFDADEVFQTLVIAKNNVAYSQTLTSIEGSLPNVALTVSVDGGSNFISSTFGSALNTINTSTNGIILKMVATSDADESTDIVSRITCNYS